MITFNGRSIQQAAPGIKIEDIRESPVQLAPVTHQRPIIPGVDYIRMQQGARTIAINFAILEMDKFKRKSILNSLSKWARSDAPAPLSLVTRPGVLIDAICTKLPEPSLRQWWESKLQIVFTAFDPYWYSVEEKSVSCGTAFFANGDIAPFIKITRTLSSAVSSTQTYSSGGEQMKFTQMPAGNLEIDLNRQTAKVGNNSIMQYFNPTTTFITPKTGTQTISGTGTVKWRERWI